MHRPATVQCVLFSHAVYPQPSRGLLRGAIRGTPGWSTESSASHLGGIADPRRHGFAASTRCCCYLPRSPPWAPHGAVTTKRRPLQDAQAVALIESRATPMRRTLCPPSGAGPTCRGTRHPPPPRTVRERHGECLCAIPKGQEKTRRHASKVQQYAMRPVGLAWRKPSTTVRPRRAKPIPDAMFTRRRGVSAAAPAHRHHHPIWSAEAVASKPSTPVRPLSRARALSPAKRLHVRMRKAFILWSHGSRERMHSKTSHTTCCRTHGLRCAPENPRPRQPAQVCP